MILSMPFFSASLSFAADGDSIRLDADVISFEESTGVATADGNVRISNDEFYVTAPYLEYDNNSRQMTAFSSPGQKVSILTAGRRLEGDRIDYNLETRRGRIINPNGRADVFHVRGKEVEVMPSQAPSDGQEEAEEELSAIWSGATLTTCNQPHPHYRLEARSVTIYPGRKMVIHSAKAYLGDVMVLATPFDITVNLGEKHMGQSFFPRLGYDQNKGAGLGITGSLNWNSGGLDMDIVGWSNEIFEMDALARQYFTPDLSIYAGLMRAYDKNVEETDWRYRWGLDYSLRGWDMSVGWTRKELLSVEESVGSISWYTLERNPEVKISSPWFPDPAVGGRFRVFGMWGNYSEDLLDTAGTYNRTGLGAQITGEPWAGQNVTPFYNATYTHYLYDDDIRDLQQVLNARAGVLFSLGRFDFKTAYLRQWAWGCSPMAWDNYIDRNELYQEIGVTIPMNLPAYYWNIGVRAAYDFRSDELAEMVYRVAYNNHCLLWEAVYRNDLKGDDDWIGLTLSVTDLPSGGFRLFGMGSDLSDPFEH